MPEMLRPTGAIMGAGLAQKVALITDGRFSGASRGFIIGQYHLLLSMVIILRICVLRLHIIVLPGHVVPEARVGGPIALVKDGDKITIDCDKRSLEWHVGEVEQAERKKEWEGSDKGKLTERRGVLFKYARDAAVSNPSCFPCPVVRGSNDGSYIAGECRGVY